MKRNEIEGLLPGVFQHTIQPGGVLFALLEVMEALHEPDEEVLRTLPRFFNPLLAPDDFIPYLARWVDLGRILGDGEAEPKEMHLKPLASGLGRLRDLIGATAWLSKWRGTARGLILFLETATGVLGFDIDEKVLERDGQPRPFHVLIRAPAAAKAYRAMVEQIVELEKPAYVTYELQFMS